jgi:hypothetical protein
LFGPRGTGKSTWIHAAVRSDVSYDLLDAGRADMKRLFPLVSAEIGPGIDIDRMIECGSLASPAAAA